MRVKVFCGVGIHGSRIEDEIELEDSLTDEEIDEQVFNYICNNLLDWGCEIIE